MSPGAVPIISRQPKDVLGRSLTLSNCHDLAVGLYGNRVGIIMKPCEIGGELAITAEGCVEAAIGVKSGRAKSLLGELSPFVPAITILPFDCIAKPVAIHYPQSLHKPCRFR